LARQGLTIFLPNFLSMSDAVERFVSMLPKIPTPFKTQRISGLVEAERNA
jgi:hypothetical protein